MSTDIINIIYVFVLFHLLTFSYGFTAQLDAGYMS